MTTFNRIHCLAAVLYFLSIPVIAANDIVSWGGGIVFRVASPE